jgi:hypothetical protein
MGFEPTTFCMASVRFVSRLPVGKFPLPTVNSPTSVLTPEARAMAGDHARCGRIKGKNAARLPNRAAYFGLLTLTLSVFDV